MADLSLVAAGLSWPCCVLDWQGVQKPEHGNSQRKSSLHETTADWRQSHAKVPNKAWNSASAAFALDSRRDTSRGLGF